MVRNRSTHAVHVQWAMQNDKQGKYLISLNLSKLTPVSHRKREQHVFFSVCMLNECIHTGSRAWASHEQQIVTVPSLFLLHCLCWIKVTVHCSWSKLTKLTLKITNFTIKSCKWCASCFTITIWKNIKCTKTHHFHKLLPKLQRSVKLIKQIN